MVMVRLQKFLSQAGVCSRRKGEAHILQGDVVVNGAVVMALGTKIDPEIDTILFRGERVVKASPHIYVMLNKPQGYVSSCRHRNDKIVTQLVDVPHRLFPVGRLDKDSTGLLLLTNDGRIHHRLSHPSFDHEKEYDVTVQRPMDDQALRTMEKGMSLSGVMTRPAKVRRLSNRRFRLILKEGRNRQIRRMVKKVGNRVTRLHRTRVAGLTLGNLAQGTWRLLSQSEIQQLLTRLQIR
jgi:pseudouridine synthase